MYLVFLGDSFTYGFNLDAEYALNNNYIKNYNWVRKDFYIDNKYSKEITDFQENNRWSSLLSNDLKIKHYNLALGGYGWQQIFNCVIEHEFNHHNEEKIYIIGCPFTHGGRLMVSSDDENKVLSKNFKTILFSEKKEDDMVFFKKYFDKKYFYMMEMSILLSIINYLNNRKIKFIFLPTWFKNIYMHFFIHDFDIELNDRKKYKDYFLSLDIDNKRYLDLYNKFIFNQIDMSIVNSISDKYLRLPCGHPNLESQKIIKNELIKYVEKIL